MTVSAVTAEHKQVGVVSCLVYEKMDKAKKLSGAENRKRKREREMACQGMRQQLNKWMVKGNR